jgi:endonuclease-3
MNKKISEEIISILEEEIPNPKPELNFSNNFELLVAVMLSAQTKDKNVNEVTNILFKKYPDPYSLSQANLDELISIIKNLGLANNKAKNLISTSKIIHEEYVDVIPSSLDKLQELPGVGRKTANVVLALGFNIPALPVDTHLYKMAIRLGYVKENSTLLETEESLKKYIDKSKWIKAHHLFLLYGRYFCKKINPKCDDCKLKIYCKHIKK